MTIEEALINFNRVIERYKERIGTIGQEREAHKVAAQEKFDAIDRLIQAIGGKIYELEQHIAANEALVQENARLKTEIASLTKNLVDLQTEKDTIAAQIAALQNQIVSLTSENADIKGQLDSLNNQLASIRAELAAKTAELLEANNAFESLNAETQSNIELIEKETQKLEQELGRLNINNTQIDAEIIGKLEALRVKLAGMSGNSGAAAAMSGDRAERISRVYYVNDGNSNHSIYKSDFIRNMSDIIISENTSKKKKIEEYLRDKSTSNLFVNDDTKLGELFQKIPDLDFQRIMEIELGLPPQTIPFDFYPLYGGGKPKSKKKTYKKNKRINKMRRTNKRKSFRGGWTYKGSPSLDSKSSVITESEKTKSSKSKSRSSKIKSNKKHKSKKVIRRYKR